ncbi:formate dehydrogenase subunit delta [Methylobacter sp.]|uniref:formate dehydrogenase subunit delta n=1 Tax=Methylobacter sp. TaxID=2051955 RepID=UPI002FDDE96A
MHIEQLIKMANDISNFFDADSDKQIAAEGMKNHLTRNWERRMRQEIIKYCREDGSELSSLAKAAITKLAA